MDDFLDNDLDSLARIDDIDDVTYSSVETTNFLDDSSSGFDDSFGASNEIGYEDNFNSSVSVHSTSSINDHHFVGDYENGDYSSYGSDFSNDSFSAIGDDGFDNDSFIDEYIDEDNTSYGENIASSIKGIVLGVILLLFSIGFLWWNEMHSVKMAGSIKDMQKNIVTLNSTIYDPQYDNKAVILQGELTPVSKITDKQFNVSSNGLVLTRHVSMLQWVERSETKKSDQFGGDTNTTTRYRYYKVWSASKIDSSLFKHPKNHENPAMNYKSKRFTSSAKMGDFNIGKNIVSKITPDTLYDGLSTMPKKIANAVNYKTYLYIGQDPANAKIGDIKISYTYAPSGVYTFAAMQKGHNILSYTTKNGTSMMLIRKGMVSANSLFQEELNQNKHFTWVFRIAGIVLMYTAFILILMPISVILNVIPLFGSIASFASGIVSGILTFILGSLVIALAWFSARPVMSLIILAIAGGIALLFSIYGKRRKKSRRATRRSRVSSNKRAHTPQAVHGFSHSSTPPPPRRG